MISPSATRMTGEAHISATRMKRAVDTLESDRDRYRLDLARDPLFTQAGSAIQFLWTRPRGVIAQQDGRSGTSKRLSGTPVSN
jgi:hypothetical protein